MCRLELGNLNKKHRFESHIPGNRILDTCLLRMSAIYETTKVPWRQFHVRANGPALYPRKIEHLPGTIKPGFLSCYPPETSSNPQILKQ